MMRRVLALLICATMSVTATGCMRSKTGSTVMTIGGGTMMVIGGVMAIDLAGPGEDTDGDGKDEFPDKELVCMFGGCLVAYGLLATGIVLTLLGVIGMSQSFHADKITVTPPPPPVMAPGQGIPRAALPEHPCDALTLQLAMQARSLASRGECSGVDFTVAQITKRNPSYAKALLVSPALAPCRNVPR